MENLYGRFNGNNGGLYDYSQLGGAKNKKKTKDKCEKSEKSEKYENFKELYLKTKKELAEANDKIKELESR